VRALLDSSVLIAAVISRAGTCATLLEDVLNDHKWITSDFILRELSRKLRDKFKYPEDEIAEIRETVMISAEFVTPVEIPSDVCRDPNDLPILGTAVAGRAEVIITGDKDLLALETFRGIPIVRPGEFWKLLGSLWESPNTSSEQDEPNPSGGSEISNK
jgi:putative PIN family toxin of toxin-antitoxin system